MLESQAERVGLGQRQQSQECHDTADNLQKGPQSKGMDIEMGTITPLAHSSQDSQASQFLATVKELTEKERGDSLDKQQTTIFSESEEEEIPLIKNKGK